MSEQQLPVVVIGAGPIGLAAAAQLSERNLEFLVLESGPSVAAAIEEWRHVRLFSPWRYDIDPAARRVLDRAGWVEPENGALPTGGELVDFYLSPLAKTPELADRIRYGAEVVAVTRDGYDRVRTVGREDAPFLIRLADGSEVRATAVIDASGTWRRPNVLGGSGIAARGETAAAGAIVAALPDVLGIGRSRFAGKRTVVVGAGHSASTTLLELGELAEQVPGTEVVWAVRSNDQSRTYGGGEADELPARGALGARVRQLVKAGRVELVSSFRTEAVELADGKVTLVAGDRRVVADVVVNSTGFRPDHAIVEELRLDLDPVLSSTRALAPLIDPNVHSCGTVPPHGVDELTHPETGYYAIGAKSYGRAPTFLLATGYEQARSVVAAIAGDWDAARQVQLDLPQTGVCSSNAAAAQGLTTGIVGGLLKGDLVLADVSAAKTSGGCCG